MGRDRIDCADCGKRILTGDARVIVNDKPTCVDCAYDRERKAAK